MPVPSWHVRKSALTPTPPPGLGVFIILAPATITDAAWAVSSLVAGTGQVAATGVPAHKMQKDDKLTKIRIATWNINSVRKRLGLLAKLIDEVAPDVICLQETKCQNDAFPMKDIRSMGLEHVSINGQKGYHGVAILSKLPLTGVEKIDFIDSGEARHISVEVATGTAPLTLHNFYVPAGGDEPDPDVNRKFFDKLAYFEAMERWGRKQRRKKSKPIMVVGDLNVAPLEQDVWSHKQLLKVVSHTPVEVDLFERSRKAGGWEDVMRRYVDPNEKLYTWWSYRSRDWTVNDRGRRLDHVWVNDALSPNIVAIDVMRHARSWEGPSDHVPVVTDIEI